MRKALYRIQRCGYVYLISDFTCFLEIIEKEE